MERFFSSLTWKSLLACTANFHNTLAMQNKMRLLSLNKRKYYLSADYLQRASAQCRLNIIHRSITANEIIVCQLARASSKYWLSIVHKPSAQTCSIFDINFVTNERFESIRTNVVQELISWNMQMHIIAGIIFHNNVDMHVSCCIQICSSRKQASMARVLTLN